MNYPSLLLISLIFLSLCLGAGCTDILGSAGGILEAAAPGSSPGADLSLPDLPPASPEPARAETSGPPPVTTTPLQGTTATTPVITPPTPVTAVPTISPTTSPVPTTSAANPATPVTTLGTELATPTTAVPTSTETTHPTTVTSTPLVIPTPQEGDIAGGVEVWVFRLTNEERAKEGVAPLVWDGPLAAVARSHSADMAEHQFFSHTNLRGEGPIGRAARMGYPTRKDLGGGWYSEGIGENINQMPTGNVIGYGYVNNDAESIGRTAMKAFMASPGHRANILKGQYTNLGVGVAYDGTYYYTTQNFW